MAMYFAHSTHQRIKIIGIVLAVYVSIIGTLAWLFPEKSASYSEAYIRWFVGIPLFLVAWFALEWFGTKILNLPFWQRMPGIARVTLLVVSIVIVTIAAIAAVQLVHKSNAL